MSLESESIHSFAPSTVISWLKAVENLSREELLLVCSHWSSADSAFLIEELANQYQGDSLVGFVLTSVSKRSILKALGFLSDKEIPRLSAMVSGLTLISEGA